MLVIGTISKSQLLKMIFNWIYFLYSNSLMLSQLHSNYINQCVENFLCLKKTDYLPLDVICFIIDIYWNFRSDPVFIIRGGYVDYANIKCNLNNMKDQLKKMNIRYYQCQYDRFQDEDNKVRELITTSYPGCLQGLKSLIDNLSLFGLLIPGFVWDHIIGKHQNDTTGKYHWDISSVQILYKELADKILIVSYYINFDKFEQWLFTALTHTAFVKVQNQIL